MASSISNFVSIILLKKFIKLNANIDMIIKKQETGGIKQKDCKDLNNKTLSIIYWCRNVQEIC